METVPPALPPASGSPRFPVRRRLLALVLVLLGFGAGWMAAGLRASLAEKPAAGGRGESRQDLLADGWVESDQGVFTRRCQGNCRRPKVYGGGIADVMEVSCLERPCGEISVTFDVLDGQGQVIETLPLKRQGLQGERLQFVLESDKPEARRFALREFRARARVY
ncbi:SIMPL domain-containing protein [Synechococcus sp. CCY 9618]|uniref:SIMPL domain-containing protein n=1 Tax=Synechococcus sp. CCY 9618 TaxID=2815602 RepID=UPI001C22F671|nr:SIMPL domain-containing protein [Synechococcus sp. CCY 9618]